MAITTANGPPVLIGNTHKLFTERVEHDVHGHVEITSDDLVKAREKAQAFEQEMLSDE